MNPFLATDGYKTGHVWMYPKGTSKVYANFTPRSNKYAPQGIDKVVVFGPQMVVKMINASFHREFFSRIKHDVCGEIKRVYSDYLGTDYDVSHIEALHDLGYLPIEIKSLPEGTVSPVGVPVLTVCNTLPEFYWLTNFLETLISNLLWKPMTSASIAHKYKKNLSSWAYKTDKENLPFVEFQGHDFSMRGMDSLDAAMTSGLGHAASFLGSDSLPVIHGIDHYYPVGKEEPKIFSVPATEHSVMCAGTKDDEIGTFRQLMKTFPTGILSVVSDTWDLWKVLTEYLPALKEEILSRDGKLVIRPDSGDPVDILCGLEPDQPGYSEREGNEKGVIELLWNVFGGTTNEQGYKVLDSHIGAIYGDSITLDRADEICRRLEDKGFASTNVVLGIGSFTYQYNTRDTFGFAMKATYVEVNGVGREIFKDPITDDGTKKSAKGLLQVVKEEGKDYVLIDQVDWESEEDSYLETIFKDDKYYNQLTFTEVRKRLQDEVSKSYTGVQPLQGEKPASD